ncbi:hypothetical protein RUM43_014806 [Polyplax serrata]|uniref:Uncharacterized protein n=1 Tax=Polyplax serrata TaxID=468196 RepID=A0AAN8S9H8_POLSC
MLDKEERGLEERKKDKRFSPASETFQAIVSKPKCPEGAPGYAGQQKKDETRKEKRRNRRIKLRGNGQAKEDGGSK